MEVWSIPAAWALLLAAASAIVLLANAAEKIVKAIKAAKAPSAAQDKRLAKLEAWKEEVDRTLSQEESRLESIDDGNRVTQRALLALLDHGIDGNNIKQMQDAKQELTEHLIRR